MTRFICIDPFPQYRAARLVKQANHQAITPSRLASRAITAPYHSLSQLALRQLERHGHSVISPLKAQAQFRQILQDTLQPSDVPGTARAWMPSTRALLKSCPELEPRPTDLSARTASLIEIAQKYQTALHKNSLVDTSELYWRATDLDELELEPLLVYGYFQLQPDERAWLNRIAADGSVLCLPINSSPLFADVEVTLDWLKEQGWEIMAGHTGIPLPPGTQRCEAFLRPDGQKTPPHLDRAYAYGTFEAEVRGTLTQVKALLHEGTPAREIAIIARDEKAYGPKLIDIAWEYGLPLRALYSTPLLTTRLGAWIRLLLDVLDSGFPFEATAKLLSHPLCSNPDGGFWAIARSQHPGSFQRWHKVAGEHLGIDLSGLAQVNQTRRRDTWVDWWQRLFKTFDLRRRCARWARESIAFNSLQEGLVALSQPETETLSWPEFRQQIDDLLESLSVPAQPGRGGVELHSPASVIGAQYSHLFVMGMAEGILPPPVKNDAVIDFFERQQLREQGIALPGSAGLFRQEALSFYYLLQTATGQITFSYPKLNERKAQLPSPYLKRMALPAADPPLAEIASPEEMRRCYLRQSDKQQDADAVLARAVRAFHIERHRESTQKANEYDGVIGVPFDYSDWAFSVSQLTSLGQCPFKWFVSKVLKLGAPAEIEEDLSPSLRGSLYHKVIELLVQAAQSNPALVADPHLLREKFLEAEQAIKLPALLNWEVRREEHLHQLSITLQKPAFWPPGATPIAVEKRFEGEWQGLKVIGRIDRIDETSNGLVLIDYKTGGSTPKGIKDANGKVSIDLQLPLYRQIAAALYPDKSVVDAQYFSLTKGKNLPVSSKAPQHELPTAIETCKSILDTGSYSVQPDAKRDACTYCDFDLVCRQGNRLARKEKQS